jgi:1-acyl-sn-glycerol-3-phosphate acyltransferase
MQKNGRRMTKRAASTLFWIFVTVSSIVLYPVAVVIWVLTVPFDRRLVVLHRFTCFWASLYTWFNPAWPVTLEGREKIRDDTTYVMVANHLSLLDILVLFRLFRHFKWVSKIENFKVPFIGWNMSMNRYIKLRRGDRDSVIEMMAECEKTIAEGNSIMMFPEGTRSPNGVLRPFKPGAFELAKKTQTAILPIVISGTADALPKRGFVLQGRHPVRIRVLDPIPPERVADMSVEQLTVHVHDLIAGEIGEPEPTAA